jgi:hypothetical protein
MMLALGFVLSSFLLYAATSFVGARLLGDARSNTAVWLIAAGILAVLFTIDTGVLGIRPLTWRRQTPKRFQYQYGPGKAAFLWGLDAGLVVTTFRVTSLSWAALTITILGLVPWWAGVAYAMGFTVPLATMILAVPRRTDPTGRTDPEPVWLVERILQSSAALRVLALLILGGACAGIFTTALLGP